MEQDMNLVQQLRLVRVLVTWSGNDQPQALNWARDGEQMP